jgi:urease accessory protein
MTHDRLLLLMQLGDSALPSGGYAFSNGLEAAYQTGVVTYSAAFEACLLDELHQVRAGELPFIHSCFEPAVLDEPTFLDLMATYDAMQLVPAVRKASEVLGRNWIRLIGELEGFSAVDGYSRWITTAKLPAHLTPLFGATMRASGATEEETKLLFVHQFVRDQISAAVRLGICGPMAAARIHRRVLPACAELVSDSIPYDQASRWLPRWDIAQCDHDHLYTRLFQN